MKRAVLSLILFTGLSALLYSCKKSTDETTFSSTPSMTASISESAWTANSLDAYFTKSAAGDTTNLIMSGWEIASDRIIHMEIMNFQAKNQVSYSVDSPAVHVMAYYQNGSKRYYGKVGFIKVYYVTPGLVQGTFDFSMKDGNKDMEVKGKFTVAPAQ